jgi:hypothetical protein
MGCEVHSVLSRVVSDIRMLSSRSNSLLKFDFHESAFRMQSKLACSAACNQLNVNGLQTGQIIAVCVEA